MTGRDLRQLERDLESDLTDRDEAVMERVRRLVKQFLLHEAGTLSGRQVRDEKEIVGLIQLHARVSLLRKLIENPAGFSLKDQKELYRSIGDEKRLPAGDAPLNPMNLIASLDVPDETKAKLVEAMTEVVRGQLRGQIGKGQQ